MTTPDKEEIPKDRTAGPWIVHYGEAVKIKDANGYTVASLSQIHLHGRRSKNEVEKTAQFIVTACNAYEPMREALILAEKADRIHSKCQECEDGAQAPEACGDCFPSADDARVARRNVLKSLGSRLRSALDAADTPSREHWDHQPVLGRGVHGVSDRVDRVGALGNAVFPPLITAIGKAVEALQESLRDES